MNYTYETDWDLYGIDELEVKIKTYQNCIKELKKQGYTSDSKIGDVESGYAGQMKQNCRDYEDLLLQAQNALKERQSEYESLKSKTSEVSWYLEETDEDGNFKTYTCTAVNGMDGANANRKYLAEDVKISNWGKNWDNEWNDSAKDPSIKNNLTNAKGTSFTDEELRCLRILTREASYSNENIDITDIDTTASSGTGREMIVLRYLKGSNKLYVYNSHMSGNSVTTTTLTAIRIPSTDSTLVLGCSKADDGAYENPAKGTIHWCKVWMADLGDEQCKDIAAWIHEEIKMELAKFKGYYLSNVSGKRANLTFVASNLLGINKAYTNAGTSSGGWAQSTLNTWLNTRLYKAISTLWKALIKPVKVYSSIGNKSINTSSSNCYFYIPSIYELDASYNQEPYSSEVAAGTQGPIPYMTSYAARRKAKASTPTKYEAYLTRSPNVDATQWLYSIDEEGNPYGYTYMTQEQGVLLMFSIGVE